MKQTKPNYKKYIFVCTNLREEGQAACGARGGEALRDTLKAHVKAMGLGDTIRVSKSGCQGPCEQGPNILVFPEHCWYQGVSMDDLDTIIETHAKE